MQLGKSCKVIVPRFTPTSFTTADFRWLHEETWDDAQKAAFLARRQTPPAGLFAPLPPVISVRRPAPVMVGHWLLEAKDGTPLAVAEAHATRANFCSVMLLISAAPPALTFLISGLLLLTKADTLRVVPFSAGAGAELTRLGVGPARQLWTPVTPLAWGFGAPCGLKITAATVDPVEWWLTPHGTAERKSLTYLEKRLDLEAEKAKPKPPRRVGLLSSLSRLLRWG